MREMKDSGIEWIGEIPVDWSMKRVKYIFTRKNKNAMQENPTILSLARDGVKVRDISNNEGQIAESYYNYNPVEEGDLLLNPMDLYSGANCSISKVQGVISPAYINLKANAGINPVFYDYYFKVQYWLMAFFSYGKGVSYDNRWTLSAETLMNYPVVALSYEEQCKRADYLNRKCRQIDTIIARQQEVIEKLKVYKLSVITEAVTKGLNPDVPMKDSGVEWIGEIPEHWEIGKLCFFTVRIGDGLHGTPEFDDKGEYYFINGNNLGNTYITIKENTKTVGLSEYNKHFIALNENTLLISLNGTIGSVSLYHGEQIILGKSAGYIILDPRRDLTLDYLRFYLQSKSVKTLFELSFAGTTINNLSLETLRNLPICIMTTEELQYSAERCEDFASDGVTVSA